MPKTELMPFNPSPQRTSNKGKSVISRISAGILLGTAFMAFIISDTVDRINAWNILALCSGSSGMFLLFRRYLPLAWIGASLPFWLLSSAWQLFMYAALGLVFVGLGTIVALPYLARQGNIDSVPDVRASSAPLVEVPKRTFRFRTGKIMFALALTFSGALILLGCVLLLFKVRDGGWSALIVGAVLLLSFAASYWINSRGRYRIDASGIYGRAFLREAFIPWTQVSSLFLRRQYMPGLGQLWIYYCVGSAGKVIAFPHTLVGATELREYIEKATGMAWPAANGE